MPVTVLEEDPDLEVIKQLSLDPELWERIAKDGVMKDDFKLHPDYTYLLMTVESVPIGYWVAHPINTATIMIHCQVLERYRKPHYTEFGRLVYEWFISDVQTKYVKLIAEVPSNFESVCRYCDFFDMKVEGKSPQSEWSRSGELVDRIFYGISREQVTKYLGVL